MSGYTKPLENLGPEDLGFGHWMLYSDSILTTWPCRDNRQWFIGVKRADLRPGETPDRSVWKGATPDTVNGVYGAKFHPAGHDGTIKSSKSSLPPLAPPRVSCLSSTPPTRAVVDQSERVVASNVFAEVDFPTMAKGRVALLGDGK
jgi:salicylate hydroxylase